MQERAKDFVRLRGGDATKCFWQLALRNPITKLIQRDENHQDSKHAVPRDGSLNELRAETGVKRGGPTGQIDANGRGAEAWVGRAKFDA